MPADVGPAARPEPAVDIFACPNGPFLIRGDIDLRSMDADTAIDREPSSNSGGAGDDAVPTGAQRDQRRVVALCRCGASSIRPFCDGTHKVIGFRTVRPAR